VPDAHTKGSQRAVSAATLASHDMGTMASSSSARPAEDARCWPWPSSVLGGAAAALLALPAACWGVRRRLLAMYLQQHVSGSAKGGSG
jgi:hypothetical protein